MESPIGRIRPVMLLVEDDVDDRRFFQWALRKSGLDIVLSIATDGEQAIEYLSHGPERLSLILCDIHLPKISGWEVLQWIRRQPSRVRTPVLLWTSLPNPEGEQKARQLGATSYFAKPHSTDGYHRLVGVISDHLQD